MSRRTIYRKEPNSHWDYGLGAWIEPKADGFEDVIIHAWESDTDSFAFASVVKINNESILVLDAHAWVYCDGEETSTVRWDVISNDWTNDPYRIREALLNLYGGCDILRFGVDRHPMLEIPSVEAELARFRPFVDENEYDRMSCLLFEQRFGALCHVNPKWMALRNSPDSLVTVCWEMTTKVN